MDALDQSAALIRRGAELRERSIRVRAAVTETVESCRRLMDAPAQEAVIRAHGREDAGRTGKAMSGELARRPVARRACPPPGPVSSMVNVDLDSGNYTGLDSEDWEAPRRESRALRQESQQARARARMTRHKVRVARSHKQKLGDSGFVWLQDRMGTMPVIEQAKGILMAQQVCGPDEAFDVLRRMSQQANVKLHVLAAQIVEHVAASGNRDNVTPISLGTRQYRHLQA